MNKWFKDQWINKGKKKKEYRNDNFYHTQVHPDIRSLRPSGLVKHIQLQGEQIIQRKWNIPEHWSWPDFDFGIHEQSLKKWAHYYLSLLSIGKLSPLTNGQNHEIFRQIKLVKQDTLTPNFCTYYWWKILQLGTPTFVTEV